jgi:UDP-N-acetylmuramoylalanine-D-glutamate ligase
MQRRSLTEEYMYMYRLLSIVVEASIASKAIRPPDKSRIHIVAGGTRKTHAGGVQIQQMRQNADGIIRIGMTKQHVLMTLYNQTVKHKRRGFSSPQQDWGKLWDYI